MQPVLATILAAAVLATAATTATTAHAGSLAASSAAGGSSASAGSSASSDASSNSSGGAQRAAAGPYRIIDVAAVADRPGLVRLQLLALHADAGGAQHVLLLPQAVVDQHRLVAGRTVTARAQAYGTEFVDDSSRQAFFLVLSDGWQRELAPQPLRL